MNKIWIADVQILTAAFFFGIGFIGQRAVSVDGLGPMTCNALRFALSALLLVLVLPWIPAKWLHESTHDVHSKEKDREKDALLQLVNGGGGGDHNYDSDDGPDGESGDVFSILFPAPIARYLNTHHSNAQRSVLFWGVFLGSINFLGSGLQQWGITLTSANKVAFIAGFDLFLTPLFALCIPTFKRHGKPMPSTWCAVFLSVVGMYYLSDAQLSDMSIGQGEVLTLISTVFWTLHITYTDIATTYVDHALHMMCVQLTVVSLLSAIAAVLLEPQRWFWHHILRFVPWMLFLAVVEGLGFTFMALGQHFSPPTHAAIILSLEGVFASVASYFALGEVLSSHELIGCFLMLSATLFAKMGCQALDNPAVGTNTSANTALNNNGWRFRFSNWCAYVLGIISCAASTNASSGSSGPNTPLGQYPSSTGKDGEHKSAFTQMLGCLGRLGWLGCLTQLGVLSAPGVATSSNSSGSSSSSGLDGAGWGTSVAGCLTAVHRVWSSLAVLGREAIEEVFRIYNGGQQYRNNSDLPAYTHSSAAAPAASTSTASSTSPTRDHNNSGRYMPLISRDQQQQQDHHNSSSNNIGSRLQSNSMKI